MQSRIPERYVELKPEKSVDVENGLINSLNRHDGFKV